VTILFNIFEKIERASNDEKRAELIKELKVIMHNSLLNKFLLLYQRLGAVVPRHRIINMFKYFKVTTKKSVNVSDVVTFFDRNHFLLVHQQSIRFGNTVNLKSYEYCIKQFNKLYYNMCNKTQYEILRNMCLIIDRVNMKWFIKFAIGEVDLTKYGINKVI